MFPAPSKNFLKVAGEILITLDNSLKMKFNIKNIYDSFFFSNEQKKDEREHAKVETVIIS